MTMSLNYFSALGGGRGVWPEWYSQRGGARGMGEEGYGQRGILYQRVRLLLSEGKIANRT